MQTQISSGCPEKKTGQRVFGGVHVFHVFMSFHAVSCHFMPFHVISCHLQGPLLVGSVSIHVSYIVWAPA